MERVKALRRAVPNIGITTDFIVGFPGETEAQFMDSVSLVDEIGYDSAFTFIFSPRVGTAAAKREDQVPADVSARRIRAPDSRPWSGAPHASISRWSGRRNRCWWRACPGAPNTMVSGKGRRNITVTFAGERQVISVN